MRKVLFRSAAAAFFYMLVSAVPLYADLDSFKDAIESAEEDNREKEDEKPPPKQEKRRRKDNDNLNDSDDDGGLTLLRLFFEIFGNLWLYNNLDIAYGPYPYCQNSFIRRPMQREGIRPDDEKEYSYSLGLSGLYLSDMGGGSWLSFSGNMFRFIGPYADVFLIGDGEDVLNGFRIGMHLSLFQSNIFNTAFYLQYQLWYGFMQRDACVAGFEFRVYPVKPLTLRARFGFQIFEYLTLGETELEAGCMIGGWEIFAGYRWWYIMDEGRGGYPVWNGPSLGLRRYF
jgi:hypothetical protein